MIAIDAVLWIVEANHQQVLTVALDGTVAGVWTGLTSVTLITVT